MLEIISDDLIEQVNYDRKRQIFYKVIFFFDIIFLPEIRFEEVGFIFLKLTFNIFSCEIFKWW